MSAEATICADFWFCKFCKGEKL
ncbi:uncharacterized protein METZ01_LOCUS120233 [marine metagenome]|uniref:Uncharacterized protein n=1 Tax=marine metagenome TaxID=408172 RepID=A0A381XRJ1_9ZZZZ